MRAESLVLNGETLRFCQKCVRLRPAACTRSVVRALVLALLAKPYSDRLRTRRCNRLQLLTDFEGSKHTCAAALASHNARRRHLRRPAAPPLKRAACDAAAVAADSPDVPPQLAATGATNVCTWLTEHAPEATTAVAAEAAVLFVRANAGSAAAMRADLSAAAAAAAAAAALHGCTVHIKLPALHSPCELPSSALRAAVDDALFPGAAVLPTGAVRPGCVLLSLDALLPGQRRREMPLHSAGFAEALRLAFSPSALQRGVLRVGDSQVALDADEPASNVPLTPQLRLMPAAALLRGGGGEGGAPLFDVGGAADALVLGTVHARLSGHALRSSLDAGRRVLQLHADSEGAALVEVEHTTGDASSFASETRISPARVVLLCTDAAVVAQVAATCSHAVDSSAADDEALQRVLHVLGAALRPRSSRRVRCAAAAAAVWLGWDAVLARLLRAHTADTPAVVCCAAAHAAARGRGTPAACDVVIAAAVSRLWPPAACAHAVRLLEEASVSHAHLQPECAAGAALQAALQAADTGVDDAAAAAQLLAALLELLADVDDVVVDSLADDEASYVTWLARHNARHWVVVSSLAVLGSAVVLLNASRHVLFSSAAAGAVAGTARFGAVNDALIAATRLHSLDGSGGVRSPLDVPWGDIVTHIRAYVVTLLALRLPAQVALLVASRRMARRHSSTRRYERTFFTLLMVDTLFYLLIEAWIMHATHAAIEWPSVPAFISAGGIGIGLQNVPFRLRYVYAFITLKLAATVVALAHARAWRVLLLNAGCLAQIAVLLSAALLAGQRDRAMRAACRAASRPTQLPAAAKLKQL
jgi:hypothetical protein